MAVDLITRKCFQEINRDYYVILLNQITKINKIKNNEMYHRIDTILFRCIGNSLSFGQLLLHINNADPPAYEYVIGRSQQILKSTYVLSQA